MFLRSFGAVSAGYTVMVFIVICYFNIMRAFLPVHFSSQPMQPMPLGWQITILCINLLGAAAGGGVAARIAPNLPFRHGYWLSLVILLLGLISVPVAYINGEAPWLGLAGGFLGSLSCLAAAWIVSIKFKLQ